MVELGGKCRSYYANFEVRPFFFVREKKSKVFFIQLFFLEGACRLYILILLDDLLNTTV